MFIALIALGIKFDEIEFHFVHVVQGNPEIVGGSPEYPPVRGRIQTAANVQQRGLTATAFAEQKYHARFGKAQGNAIQRLDARPALRRVYFC